MYPKRADGAGEGSTGTGRTWGSPGFQTDAVIRRTEAACGHRKSNRYRPDLLLADEPTGALDSVSGRQIMELFSELNQEGMTVLMITHDAQIAGCADRMVMIKDGRLKDGEEQENGKE